MRSRSRRPAFAPMFAIVFAVAGCKARPPDDRDVPAGSAATVAPAPSGLLVRKLTTDLDPGTGPAPPASLLHVRRLRNTVAYIPPQCFTKTRGDDGQPKNPCYACHTRSEAPNYVDDGDLQSTLKLPVPAATNPWTHLLTPPVERAQPTADDAVLAYVRHGNYFDADGRITLARALAKPPVEWDGNGNKRWDGFTPDVEFRFDAQGFDHRPEGAPTGWRAFAYYPFVGTFFPTNGSADDVLIRLDPALREDGSGNFDASIYVVNLAIVEALITRAAVAIDPVDEVALGVDLDRDGRLGRATRVAFDGKGETTQMQYVGRARDLQKAGGFPIAPGLFPLGTEFFHTVRYLDVSSDGVVTMAPRMKEVRYARKALWQTYDQLKAHVDFEARTTAANPLRTHGIDWFRESGVSNGQGWYYQGFIESRDGSLRPQSLEESAFCEGCHGGIGATTDGTFAFARKVNDASPARGWFHWSQRDLRGIPEPRRRDGQYEYTLYLREAGAGDELRSNAEVTSRFFDDRGVLRPAEVTALHADIARLLLPTAARAIALDRAYLAVVLEQSFDQGRDAVLAASPNVQAMTVPGEKTGIERRVDAMRLAR
jgi:hypothetical protein